MSTKFVFYSGKGGVGKTSMACTTGVHYADLGMKTLIVTTDPAANLSDVFEQEIGHHITPISGISNLSCMEIDSDAATEEYKERSLGPLRELFDEEFVAIADEQLSGPCTEEMASFDKFIDFMEEDQFDVIVFDTAPTGHTIRLLELPVDWKNHIEEASKGSGQTCMGPVSLIEDSKQKYERAIEKLRDTSQTEFVFVMQPEDTSFKETKRSIKDLGTLGINTTQIIVNGFIPEAEAVGPFFSSRYKMQMRYFNKVENEFSHLELKTMDLFDGELKGIPMFRRCREKLFNLPYDFDINAHKSQTTAELIAPVKGKSKKIFFSGKGGVGKTSMACITATHASLKGHKTLLVTTDPAAHIGNVLQRNISHEVTAVEDVDNLFAVKIDPKKASEDYKKKVLEDAAKKFNSTTILTLKEELDSPCTEEMAAFQKFLEYTQRDDFDVIVFDTAPTGHTLRLLALPMDWSKQLEFKAGESSDISAEDLEQKRKFDDAIEMLKDEESTVFSFVMYPEKTPIAEAHRASEELESLGIKTQLVVSNFVIPKEEAKSTFFKNRRKMQLGYLDRIEHIFKDSSHLEMPMYDSEIQGMEMLKEIAQSIL